MQYESFGECLKRALKEAGLSASEAARLVGFRSRNSIFRILSGATGCELKQQFLQNLHKAIGDTWPRERWAGLYEALNRERLGPERYEANEAFRLLLHGQEQDSMPFMVHLTADDGSQVPRPLMEVLGTILRAARVELVMTGCCDSALIAQLAEICGKAGAQGRLVIRHYIDMAEETISRHILSILPLVSKTWYNARLVTPSDCPPEMLAVYRVNTIHVNKWDDQGSQSAVTFVLCDRRNLVVVRDHPGCNMVMPILDHWRFRLQPLKPMTPRAAGPAMFVEYTQQYARNEEDCMILSIKPDVHFNLVPASLLEQVILEGFEQAGLASGPELRELIDTLKAVHDARFHNMLEKHKPTHLVYGLQTMERFMRTGVQSDHFFIQRAYTVEERRTCIRVLLDTMRTQPYFHVHFLKAELPPLRYEMTCYDGRGVLLMDAYTNYELAADHSEALVTLPAFQEMFKRYFKEELLARYVLSRADSIRALEHLLTMDIHA